ncbi:MFS transporter [Chloroflexus islandicus]|uniref:MFS transporter n=1 Tax=Chloroflexus islandicus TaxID=1707952 RepID=A0A178MBM0_9CHLR|nr:MFS transporter [Chloroflexus islandicus]OAN46190.1 MFS transporter [Chloroflexus islandicus]
MTTLTAQYARELTWPQLLTLVWGRWLVSLAFRMVYPLLGFLAAGFAVDLTTASLLITVQVAASLLSPLGGMLSDSIGDRATMIWGGVIFTIGAALCAMSAAFIPFLLGYAVIGLAIAVGMPALQSYVSARSRYERRARMLGVLELSWALSALLGVPLITWGAERWGIAPIFAGLTIAGSMMVISYIMLPNDAQPPSRQPHQPASANQLWHLLRQPNILAALGFIFIQLAAVELIFVSYAGWLSSAFNATTAELGFVFGLLGVVELIGSLGATLFTDRIGKRRAVLGGFLLVGVWLLLLPQSGSWPVFLALLLAFDLCFEFAIVSTFPLMSGLSAQWRGALLALMTACIGGGRIVGSLAGPWISATASYALTSTIAGILVLIGVGIGVLFMKEGDA